MPSRHTTDVHQDVTDRMISALEKGTVPWRKPWNCAMVRPTSMTTRQPYHGINTLLLGMASMEAGYSSPFWGTYRQIAALGGQVRRGEHGTHILLWKSVPRWITNDEGDREQIPVLLAREFTVFNAEQADGLPARYFPGPADAETLPQPQQVLDAYLAGGPSFRHVAGDRAYYQPATDAITLPERGQFRSPAHYYSTAFHEAGHSTGHASRLDREGITTAGTTFGCERYAREELVAQMTSTFVLTMLGIDTAELFDNSAAYLASWLKALQDDKKLVISAAAAAEKASSLIMGQTGTAEDAEPHVAAMAA